MPDLPESFLLFIKTSTLWAMFVSYMQILI